MGMSDSVVAVIPVREGSQRVVNKNFKAFGNSPTLLHRKIAHLRSADCFGHIYVSSDSQKASDIAREENIEFLARDAYHCSGAARWDEVVVHILNTIPGDPWVVWAMVTSPLFTRYRQALDLFLQVYPKFDSLVGVKEIREYLIDEVGRPLFYSFGVWHPYTTEIKPMFAINDTLFIAKKSDQLLWRYWLGRKPYLFKANSIESIDINGPDDWALAEVAERVQVSGKTQR